MPRFDKTTLLSLSLAVCIVIFIFTVTPIPNTYAQTPPAYPFLPPSNLVEHTTTATISGPASKIFIVNMTQLDSQSPITELTFNMSGPITNIRVFTFQLSDFPTDVPPPNYKPLLIIQVNVYHSQSYITSAVTSAVIDLRVPKNIFSSSTVDSNSIAIQRHNNGEWTTLNLKVTGSDSQYFFLQTSSPGLSIFAVTVPTPSHSNTPTHTQPSTLTPTLPPTPTPTQAIIQNPLTVGAIIFVVFAVVLLFFYLRRNL